MVDFGYFLHLHRLTIKGGGNDNARGPPLIDQEIDAVIGITNNNIVVVGDISALPDNIDLNINNVATCSTITGKCKSVIFKKSFI